MQDARIQEFQTCGEIMVAASTKTIVVACNFCQQTFLQLPAFMRHLQLQHNDKLKFTKQTNEMEVYAYEELLNQTTNSSVADITEEHNSTEDDAAWMSDHDMKWVNESIASNNQQDADDDEANLSVLTNLANIKNKIDSEPKKIIDLDNTLLKEIRNEWDQNDTISSRIDSCDTQLLNSFDKEENLELETQHLNYNRPAVDALDKIKGMLRKSTRTCVQVLLRHLKNNVADIEEICKNSSNLNFTDVNNTQLEANNFVPKKALEGINCNYESDNLNKFDLSDDSKEEKETDQSEALSEDLTKVLADALDSEGLDLLNIPPAEDIENILDTDMINLLENQSLEKENETNFKELKENSTKTQSQVLRATNANNFATKKKVPNEKLFLSKESISVTTARDSCNYFKENVMSLPHHQQFSSNKMNSPTNIKRETNTVLDIKKEQLANAEQIIFIKSPKSQDASIEYNSETPINFNMKTTGEKNPKTKSSGKINKNTSTPERRIKKNICAQFKQLSVKLEKLTSYKLNQQRNKPKRKFFKTNAIIENTKEIDKNTIIQQENSVAVAASQNVDANKTELPYSLNITKDNTSCKLQDSNSTDKNLHNKNEAIQPMLNIKKQIVDNKSPFIIQNVQILPKLERDVITSFMSTASANLSLDNETTSITQDAHSLQKTLKRSASYPLLNKQKQTKLQHKSLNQEKVIGKTCKQEATEFELTASAQQDVKVNRLNIDKSSAGSSTVLEKEAEDAKYENSNNSIRNDLLKQVVKVEKKMKNVTQSDNLGNNPGDVVDFDDIQDNELLAKFGLTIIKIPEIEDVITLEERDELYGKAFKFAIIYKKYEKVWLVRHATMILDLNKSFNELLIAVNLEFKLNLSLVELKRLTNLINLWYTTNFTSKLIDKHKISESTNRYLLLYHFIPKTTRRLIFCEYCEENFNTEHKYLKHRITHTGALFPYYCKKCLHGFKAPRFLKYHKCNSVENNQILMTQPSTSNSRLTPLENKSL